MKILAIDPGDVQSAWLVYDSETKEVEWHAIEPNEKILLMDLPQYFDPNETRFAVEMVASYGMPVGKTVFDTCVWIGRFIQWWESQSRWLAVKVYRGKVKMHLCNSMRAKDSNIRQAIIDRYPASGGGAVPQVGTKGLPGPLYGISKDKWSAIAVAITFAETGQI